MNWINNLKYSLNLDRIRAAQFKKDWDRIIYTFDCMNHGIITENKEYRSSIVQLCSTWGFLYQLSTKEQFYPLRNEISVQIIELLITQFKDIILDPEE